MKIRPIMVFGIISVLISSAQAGIEFNSVTGFSDTQGANGWSYATVLYSNKSDLYNNQILMTYNTASSTWKYSSISISATAQNKTEGASYFSLRYWTADQDYSQVIITSTLSATNPSGAYLAYVDAATHVTTMLAGTFWATSASITAGGGTQVITINKTVENVKAGDRIYFVLQNSGTSGADSSMQVWNQTITATPVPEAASLSVLGLSGCALLRHGRRQHS